MGIYLMVLGAVTTSLLMNVNRRLEYQKIFIMIVFFILTLLAAIRSYTVGVDTLQYYNNFYVISMLEWDQVSELRYEPGYFYLCKLLSYFSQDPHILIAVTSMIIIPTIGRFIIKYSNDVTFSTFIYISYNIYFFHLTGMRQSLAVVIFLIAFDYLLKDKLANYILLIFLASLFHSSAIILLVLLLLKKIEYHKYTAIYITGSIIFGCIFYREFFGFITNSIGKYDTYFDSRYDFENYYGAFFIFLLCFVLYLICHFIIIKNKEKIKNMNIIKLMLWSFALATFSTGLAMRMNIIGRMAPYFLPYSLILIPIAVDSLKGTTRWLVKFGIVCVMISFFCIVGIFRPEWNGAIPYSTLLSD